MKGLELSKDYYEEYGKPMLKKEFPALLPYLAAGLFGSGSECFGYDDTISQDHDFEPGFCIFLPDENLVSRREEFLLERAYAKLPNSFKGYNRTPVSPVGGARHGVFRTKEFFARTVGLDDGCLSLQQWLSISEQALLEATNGKVFFDHLGEVTRIREVLSCFPEEIRIKRLAGHLLLMAQAGQYNYRRCLMHNEPGAAQLAITEFVKSCLSVVFLLNRHYQPYYKWVFRALRDLAFLAELGPSLEYLITTDNSSQSENKTEMIEDISNRVIKILFEQNLTRVSGFDLESHAYSVNDRIKDPTLRNMHILAAV